MKNSSVKENENKNYSGICRKAKEKPKYKKIVKRTKYRNNQAKKKKGKDQMKIMEYKQALVSITLSSIRKSIYNSQANGYSVPNNED